MIHPFDAVCRCNQSWTNNTATCQIKCTVNNISTNKIFTLGSLSLLQQATFYLGNGSDLTGTAWHFRRHWKSLVDTIAHHMLLSISIVKEIYTEFYFRKKYFCIHPLFNKQIWSSGKIQLRYKYLKLCSLFICRTCGDSLEGLELAAIFFFWPVRGRKRGRRKHFGKRSIFVSVLRGLG